MSYDMKESGERIRQLRIENSLTQEKVASMLNIDRSFYNRIESGKKGCSIDLLVQLSDLFHVSLDYLLGNTDMKQCNNYNFHDFFVSFFFGYWDKCQIKIYERMKELSISKSDLINETNIDLEKDTISLLDLQIPMPIFREESILTFENLYNQNERNFPKQDIKPNFVRTKNKIQDFVLHPEVELKDRNNYKITDNDLGIGTPREKFERNIAAIKVLKKCEEENRYATPEEQEIMSKYVGWGGLQQAFKEDDSSWSNEYKILKELLNDEEYKNARSSVLTAFYTPPIVINSMYEILENMGLKEANILEPSCGVGNFLGMLPTQLKECKMYGVELDSISGRIARQLYQKSTIAVNAYEKVELPDSFFDVAVRQCAF